MVVSMLHFSRSFAHALLYEHDNAIGFQLQETVGWLPPVPWNPVSAVVFYARDVTS